MYALPPDKAATPQNKYHIHERPPAEYESSYRQGDGDFTLDTSDAQKLLYFESLFFKMDPDGDGSMQINRGLRQARELLLQLGDIAGLLALNLEHNMWDDALQLIAEHPAYAPQVYLTLPLTLTLPYRRSTCRTRSGSPGKTASSNAEDKTSVMKSLRVESTMRGGLAPVSAAL